MVTVKPETIPERFKQRGRWLMWDNSSDTPRRPHWKGNFGVSYNDPDDWHRFEEAYSAMQKRESWGIGYVFQSDDDEYMLDIDGPYNDDGEPREDDSRRFLGEVVPGDHQEGQRDEFERADARRPVGFHERSRDRVALGDTGRDPDHRRHDVECRADQDNRPEDGVGFRQRPRFQNRLERRQPVSKPHRDESLGQRP